MPLPLRSLIAAGCAVVAGATSAAAPPREPDRLRAAFARVTLTRDRWGIAHVFGPTDADAVFGMVYAQAQDDFPRIETNYATALGRLAAADGEALIWSDLRARMYAGEPKLRALYAQSPAELRALMDAWADGLNHYLASHSKVRPRYIARFEPWMALSFTEGSIGGDIERISLTDLAAFYDRADRPTPVALAAAEQLRRGDEAGGSNGVALAPKMTRNGRALLLINPHTSFYFRSELQVSSGEGLDAYGAATWGQFFIYQGWNPHLGWMHTTSSVDAVDEFAETVSDQAGRLTYRYGAESRPVESERIVVPYRTAAGESASRAFTVFRTHHGPIVRRAADGRWIAFAMMDRPIEALSQSFLRTKADSVAGYLAVADRFQANSSNNSLLADDRGHIAFAPPQFIPVRDPRWDYTRPVDGADPGADWRGVTAPGATPRVIDPPNGWVMNANDWAFSAAGRYSPRPEAYPKYMDTVGETPRGVHLTRLLDGASGFTLQRLRAAAFDPTLPEFERLIPRLLAAYDGAADGALKARVADQIGVLRGWDRRWAGDSVATTLAMTWGERLWAQSEAQAKASGVTPYVWMETRVPPEQLLRTLAEASDGLRADFGDWRVPWGDINRFQRLTPDIKPVFSDTAPSVPVPFASGRWGSLASFASKPWPGTKRWYGTSGNSFVAVVEFGPQVRALAVTAGGESGDPRSPHFADQIERYASGRFRAVEFQTDHPPRPPKAAAE